MKKLITLIIGFTLITSLFAARTVMVDNEGVLLYPNKETFKEKNEIVSTGNLSVFIDTYKGETNGIGDYWTDCELKVLDENGNMLYFFSTIMFENKKVQALHDSALNDNNAIVYYYASGNGENGVCVKPKTLFESTDNSSIGVTIGDNKIKVTGIQIYPSVEFKDIFLNPDNSIMIWRQTPTLPEIDGNNEKLWRPALIQLIR